MMRPRRVLRIRFPTSGSEVRSCAENQLPRCDPSAPVRRRAGQGGDGLTMRSFGLPMIRTGGEREDQGGTAGRCALDRNGDRLEDRRCRAGHQCVRRGLPLRRHARPFSGSVFPASAGDLPCRGCRVGVARQCRRSSHHAAGAAMDRADGAQWTSHHPTANAKDFQDIPRSKLIAFRVP